MKIKQKMTQILQKNNLSKQNKKFNLSEKFKKFNLSEKFKKLNISEKFKFFFSMNFLNIIFIALWFVSFFIFSFKYYRCFGISYEILFLILLCTIVFYYLLFIIIRWEDILKKHKYYFAFILAIFLLNILSVNLKAHNSTKTLITFYYLFLSLTFALCAWEYFIIVNFSTLKKHIGPVWSVKFSPSGKYILSAGEDKTSKIFSRKNKNIIANLNLHLGQVRANSFSPDEKLILSGGEEGNIKLWSFEEKKEIYTVLVNSNKAYDIYDIKFNPKGNIFASASSDKLVNIWDTKTGEKIQILQGHTSKVFAIDFSQSGKILASCGEDCIIRIWDLENEFEICALKEHYDKVYDVKFSKNDKYLASSSADSTIKLWSTENWELIATFDNNKGEDITSIAFSPDDKIIAGGTSRGYVKIYKITGEPIPNNFEHLRAINKIDFSPDGKILATASEDSIIKFWKIANIGDQDIIENLKKKLNKININKYFIFINKNWSSFLFTKIKKIFINKNLIFIKINKIWSSFMKFIKKR